MNIEITDCVVLGGGPAGSTFASIAKKYAADAKVVVLEKARFPRWHIGESTIPAANGVLEDLGVYGELLASDFVKKLGVTFVWGRDRTPWNADYLTLRHEGDIIEVTGQDLRTLLGPDHRQQTPFSAFNVERSRFDELLLGNSRKLGADVREGTRATAVRRVGQGPSHVVSWEDDRGRTGRILTDFVLDATGLSHLMTKGKGEREHAPDLNNFAVFGYLRGAQWKVNYSGTQDASTVFIAAVDDGWIWYFPLGPDLMTVGAVTNTAHFKDRLQDVELETFFWEMLRSCPEVANLVTNATLRDDILPNGARVSACQDWSSWAKNPVGEGWAAAGDAAMFVDPILSTGVTLALQTGHRAAYTWLTTRARPELPAAGLWRAYADYLRGEYGSFLLLARYFYGNNKAAPSWWWEAQRLVNASGRLQLSDRQAFTMATAGFFPVPRALGAAAEVVAPLLRGITGGGEGIEDMYRNAGVPEPELLVGHDYEVLTRFRLDLRSEPGLERGLTGRLEIYHDLVTEELGLTHRLAAVPTRIDPTLAEVVAIMPNHRRVADLVAAAQALLPEQDPARVRSATLGLVRVAAMKGFVRVQPVVVDAPLAGRVGQQAAGWSARRLQIPKLTGVEWPDHGLRPEHVRAGYRFPADTDGEGETIAIMALGGVPRPEDLGAFWSAARIDPPSVELVTVGPLGPRFDLPLMRLETTMNVQWAGAMAPRAKLVVYLIDPARAADPWATFLSAILSDHARRPTIAVTTWSTPERQYYRTHGGERVAALLERAAVRGITVLAAAGDWGAYDGNPSTIVQTPERGPVRVCERLEARVGFPAVEPRVLAIGGTHVTCIAPWRESAWSAPLSSRLARAIELPALAGGGGFSEHVPIPAWQRAALRGAHPRSGDAPAVEACGRGIPDVSLMAWGPDHLGDGERAPASAVIVVDGQARSDGGGTSLAAPIWAAIVARLNQARRRAGLPRLGCANALLYRLAREHEGALRGIARGATDIRLPIADAEGRPTLERLPGFLAHPGWNPATGLGVPDVTALTRALCSTPTCTRTRPRTRTAP